MSRTLPPIGILAGMTIFSGSALVISSQTRRIFDAGQNRKERDFRNILGAAAAVSLIPTGLHYLRHRNGGKALWSVPGHTLRILVNTAFKPVAAFCIAQGILTPTKSSILYRVKGNNGSQLSSSYVLGSDDEVGDDEKVPAIGIGRITRHPITVGISLWCLSNIVIHANPTVLLFNSFFPSVAILSALAQDYRTDTDALDLSSSSYLAKTSFLPFVAIYEGRNSWEKASNEMRWELGETAFLSTILYILLTT